MTRVEQHKMILQLRDQTKKMSRDELFSFEMMIKRDKDDEDLDSLTQRKLEELVSKFIPQRSKKDLEEIWKKMTTGNNKNGKP